MRLVGRLAGWVLVFTGLGLLARDIAASIAAHQLHLAVLGELIFKAAPGALNLAQAVIQRYVHPYLWDPVIVTVLLWWAAPVAFVPGALLVLLCRKRDGRRPWR
jgi:hypothetical protein